MLFRSNFVNSIASVALSSASGKHPQDEPATEEAAGAPNDSVPDPTALAMGASGARAKQNGADLKHDKSKVPMETAMWNGMRPIMHAIGDLNDTWERFANALSPTPPFPRDNHRLRLAAVVIPMLAASIFITSYLVVKGLTFGIGFGFFGDPILTPAIKWLNSTYPNWQKLLELRNTLLKGVPTNAQLTLTLLRIGEANKAPLPPPPTAALPPPVQPAAVTDEHLRTVGADEPLNATPEELAAAMAHDPDTAHEHTGEDVAASKDKPHGKKGSRVLGALKSGVKGAVSSALGADHLKAKAGSEHAKQRLGVVPKDPKSDVSGPSDFKCRYHGQKGYTYIATKSTIPCVAFSIDKKIGVDGTSGREERDLHPIWSIPIGDIKELKKIGGKESSDDTLYCCYHAEVACRSRLESQVGSR